MAKAPVITNKSTEKHIKIYFDGQIHICLKQPEIIGFKPYISKKKNFCIKFFTSGRPIVSRYQDADQWKAVLNILGS